MDSRSVSSRLRELLKFLSTVQGDLSNVTGPPSLLAPSSVVEVGHAYAQRPCAFAAPALEPSPSLRALRILHWFLLSLRSQLYVAGAPGVSIKKPLNAFLGELFFASWNDEESKCTTRLVAEQVSHHPPITAMHIADSEHGIRADGYARVEMTFNGAVNIRQVGHAMVHIDKYEEDHLVPLVDVKVRGFLGGCMYPEITDTYEIVSSAGYITEICFSGEGMISGKRNSFKARVYEKGDTKRCRPLYEATGVWSKGWSVKDVGTGERMEEFEVEVDAPGNEPVAMSIAPLEEQDEWESRRAWAGVLAGMAAGDMRAVLAEKTKIEQAQRQLRAREREEGKKWEPLLFRSQEGVEHKAFHELAEGTGWRLWDERTKGVWRLDEGKATEKGQGETFRGELTPLG